ncbi:MAG: hypothetical protein ACYTBJ_01290 [Planctomycetota bacterium]|jgi:hypothetical protein
MNGKVWSKEEEWMLRTQWNTRSSREIAAELGRSYNSIRAKARQLALGKKAFLWWTPYEDMVLRKKYVQEKLSPKEISELLGKTTDSIKSRRIYLGIPCYRISRKWTLEEEDFLRDNWSSLKRKEIAEHLNRTVLAVTRKAQTLKISERYAFVGVGFVARRIGYHRETIHAMIRMLGLPCSYSEAGFTRVPRRTMIYLQRLVEELGWPLQPIRRIKATFVCRKCYRIIRPHYAKDLCKPCYDDAWGKRRRKK